MILFCSTKRRTAIFVAVAVAALLILCRSWAQGPTTASRGVVVSVRVHLLTAARGSPLATTMTVEGVERLWPELNRLWSPAGVTFRLESIRPEAAVPGPLPDHPHKDSPAWLLAYVPTNSPATKGLDLYFIEQCSVNGICFTNAIVVKPKPELRHVPGGSTVPLARVIAHEFGHALGLPHRHHYDNLMSPGTTGTSLNEAEIKEARSQAPSLLDPRT